MGWMLEDSRRSAFARGIGPRLGAGVRFIVVVTLSLALAWSIWVAVLSLATTALKSAG